MNLIERVRRAIQLASSLRPCTPGADAVVAVIIAEATAGPLARLNKAGEGVGGGPGEPQHQAK